MAQFRASCEQLESQLRCRIKPSWFESVREAVSQAHLSDFDRTNLLFALFLEADMNVIGAGSFPSGLKVASLRSKSLQDLFGRPHAKKLLLFKTCKMANLCRIGTSKALGASMSLRWMKP